MQRINEGWRAIVFTVLAAIGAPAAAAPVSVWSDAIQYTGAGANECNVRATVAFKERFRLAFDKKFASRWEGHYVLQPNDDGSNGLDDGLHISNIVFSAVSVDTRLFHSQRHYDLNYDLLYIHEGRIAFVAKLGQNHSILSPEEMGSSSGCQARQRQFNGALDDLLGQSLDELASLVQTHPELNARLNPGGPIAVATAAPAPVRLVVSQAYRAGKAGLIVRMTPSAKGTVVEKLGAGSLVVIKERRAAGWVQVERDGKTLGWAHPGARGLLPQ